jgi:hypothetical protein
LQLAYPGPEKFHLTPKRTAFGTQVQLLTKNYKKNHLKCSPPKIFLRKLFIQLFKPRERLLCGSQDYIREVCSKKGGKRKKTPGWNNLLALQHA